MAKKVPQATGLGTAKAHAYCMSCGKITKQTRTIRRRRYTDRVATSILRICAGCGTQTHLRGQGPAKQPVPGARGRVL